MVSFMIGVGCLLASVGEEGRADEPRRVLDLTQELSEEAPVFPGGVPFRLTAVATFRADGYFANRFELGEHTGTHVDAPVHFRAEGPAIDRLLPEQLVGPGVRLSMADRVVTDDDATLGVEDLTRWEAADGTIPRDAIVLVHTGWGQRWPDEAAYRNVDARGVLHFPGLSPEAADLLVERRVSVVGIDTLSIDPGPSTDFEVHRILAEADIAVIENLANLHQLPARGFTVVVAPLKIRGGSGSPARVLAILEDEPGE